MSAGGYELPDIQVDQARPEYGAVRVMLGGRWASLLLGPDDDGFYVVRHHDGARQRVRFTRPPGLAQGTRVREHGWPNTTGTVVRSFPDGWTLVRWAGGATHSMPPGSLVVLSEPDPLTKED